MKKAVIVLNAKRGREQEACDWVFLLSYIYIYIYEYEREKEREPICYDPSNTQTPEGPSQFS